MGTTTLLVRKAQLADTRIATSDDQPLAPGQVRVATETFALTANNVTYAAFGDAMDYWCFFPGDDEAWGVVPVWGFGRVVQSLHPGVAVGERLWGYWPMATSAILQPERLDATGFRDGAPHRAGLHAVYNQYQRCNQDPLHTPDTEDVQAVQAVLRPLFTTSWLIDDFLADNGFFGAGTLLLSSASSKTAYGTAEALSRRTGLAVVGLTSTRNRAFCQSLGCYRRVLAYEELDRLPADTPVVYVDVAGNAALRADVHRRFAQLRYSCSVGGAHVGALGGAKDLPGPRPVLFFAPAQVKKRQADWGAPVLQQRLVAAWHAFRQRVTDPAAPWLVVERHQGLAAAQAAYAQLLAGQVDPRAGQVVVLR